MPKIYEYLGIAIYIYLGDHKPIHIHAKYDNNEVKVAFWIKEGKIVKTTYTPLKGKFTDAKMRDLKKFVSVFKETIVQLWYQISVWEIPVSPVKITKRI